MFDNSNKTRLCSKHVRIIYYSTSIYSSFRCIILFVHFFLRYTILTEYLPAERLKNDFEAVRSTLIWRMDNWPGGRGLDPITDSTEYSCRSSGNDVGPPVSELIMNFSVECTLTF